MLLEGNKPWNSVVRTKSLGHTNFFFCDYYMKVVYSDGYFLCVMLGMALDFILRNNFKPVAGLRPRARKIGVLITDGKSQDDVVTPSRKLKDEGVELYAIGKYSSKGWLTATPSCSSAKWAEKWPYT